MSNIQLQTLSTNEVKQPLLEKDKVVIQQNDDTIEIVNFPNVLKFQIIYSTCVGILYTLIYYPFAFDVNKQIPVGSTVNICPTMMDNLAKLGFVVNFIFSILTILVGFYVLFQEKKRYFKLQKIMFISFWIMQFALLLAFATQIGEVSNCGALGQFAEYVMVINGCLILIICLYILIDWLVEKNAQAQAAKRGKK